MTKKKVVIVGGGFAGSLAAKKLEKKFDVTMIDTKDYFEFTPGILRSIVEPEHVRKIQVLHSHYLKRAKVVVGKVLEVGRRFVRVGKRKIVFDYLIVSSGSTYNAPFKEQRVVSAMRAGHLRHYYDDLCKAKKILIIGGGLVGVELAGEICEHYGDEKEVMIVHAKDHLIERNHPSAISYAERYFKKHGVKILFGERVKEVKGKRCVTDKGTKIEADLVFLCTGIRPNYGILKKNFSHVLSERNQIIVNDFLQVKGERNIFAAGDVTAVKEEKTAQNAERQAETIVKNICSLESNHELVAYEPRSRPLIISLGKRRAILDTGNFAMRGFIPAVMKEGVERYEMMKKRKV